MTQERQGLPGCNVSAAISTIEINAANLWQGMAPRGRWVQLDDEAWAQWRATPLQMQAITLGNQPSPAQGAGPMAPHRPVLGLPLQGGEGQGINPG